MRTNIGVIETSDEERLQIGNALGLGRMVKRKELVEEVNRYVKQLGEGRREEAEPETTAEVQEVPGRAEPASRRDSGISGFVPSRGDEDYLFKPKSVELKDKCSQMLDLAEEIEQLTWDVLESNRQCSKS